jgi:hypothetical protein
VFRREIDATAKAAEVLAAEHSPGEALARWLHRFAEFIATKRGLAAALHSGDPAFSPLPAYFEAHLRPALESLLATAVAAGEVRADVEPDEVLDAVRSLATPASCDERARSQRMVNLFIDGLRYGATGTAAPDQARINSA